MGSKHNKKRYLVIYYVENATGKHDEYVELAKRKPGAGKMAQASVVLDILGEQVLKVDLPNITQNIPFDNLYQHYRKWYAEQIDEFIAS